MSKLFLDAVENRRSIYALSNVLTVSQDEVEKIVAHAVKHTPSAFNSQSARVLVLFEGAHEALWEITRDALRAVVPADSFGPTNEKIDSFKAGAATVLFFDDHSIVEGLQERFSLYKDNFPVWAQQSNGMLQFVVWTALESEGLGASLQHYNELIEAQVKAKWSLPESWKLIAQMPFGKPVSPAGEKQFQAIEERVFVYK